MPANRLAALPDPCLRFLEERDLSAGDLEAYLSPLPDAAGVLLVGSVPEGLANEASDLDLLVLLEGDESTERLARLESGFLHPTRSADETLGYLKGVEVNLEAFRRADLGPLADSMRDVARIAADPLGAGSLPVLEARELRLLHRLRTGVPLRGGARVDAWREELGASLLAPYVAVVYFITALDYLEDALSWSRREPGSLGAAVMARIAAEALVMSALGGAGVTHPDVKWAPKQVERLMAAGAPLPEALRRLPAVLFPSGEPGDASRAYVDGVYRSAVDLFGFMRGRPDLAPFVEFTRRYCRGRHRFDTAFLDR